MTLTTRGGERRLKKAGYPRVSVLNDALQSLSVCSACRTLNSSFYRSGYPAFSGQTGGSRPGQ
ncbi:hypothetical protein KIF59_00255 [Enterobacter cloacae subsp. cloacae]|nr:hypothetical protein [Enterobacter cloacae subsp. cloacae]